ncbi:Kelch repeat-containing protein [Sphingopyxis alaskensis]|uniref:Kelch repeat-containing protein n=1 Tax=Sphingopyxis alaskensis TaxID=117207 RepID=UPI00391D5F11
MIRTVSITLALVIGLAGCAANGEDAAGLQAADLRFEDGPRLGAPRAAHQLIATADGKLLAIGGCVRSGCDVGPASATVDIIDAKSMALIGSGRLLAAHVQPSAVALRDGRVLITGGWIDGRPATAIEIFNPATGRSVAGPALGGPRANPAVVGLADGRVLIAGGYDGQDALGDALIFDPASGTLSATGRLVTPRAGASATLLSDGRVLLVGGGRAERSPRIALASAEIFDPATGRFEAAGSLAQGRYKHGALRLDNGDVLIVGGATERDSAGKLRSVERFDAATGRFVVAGQLLAGRYKLADALLLLPGNRVLVAADDMAPEIFDVARGRSSRVDYDLGERWNFMAMVRVDSRRALLAGGYSEKGIDPTDRSWVIHLPTGAS